MVSPRWPLDIVATCRTRMARLRGSVMSAANSGKYEITGASKWPSRPPRRTGPDEGPRRSQRASRWDTRAS
ncbi:hypothetical protein SGLAM104S_02255 [Streptomyces glaucescens]